MPTRQEAPNPSAGRPNTLDTITDVELALLRMATERSEVRLHSRGWPSLTSKLLSFYVSDRGAQFRELAIGALCTALTRERARYKEPHTVRAVTTDDINPILQRYSPSPAEAALPSHYPVLELSACKEDHAPEIHTVVELERALLEAASGKPETPEPNPTATKEQLAIYFAATNPVDRLVALHRLCLQFSLLGGRQVSGVRFGEVDALPILGRYRPRQHEDQHATPASGTNAGIHDFTELERTLLAMASGQPQPRNLDPKTAIKQILKVYFRNEGNPTQGQALEALCGMLSLLGGPQPGTAREPPVTAADVLPILARFDSSHTALG